MQRAIIITVAVLLLVYGAFEARKLVEGPELVILSPANGSATSSTLVTVQGTAQNIAFLTINDSPSYTDPDGKFVYTFAPPAGYTVVTVAAVDRFGRRASTSVVFDVVNYCSVKS